jgi:2-oxoglutarate dehydrogenase complex dehydrogenase (E1) component-like enzyme
MYDKIKNHSSVYDIYANKLIQKGVITPEGLTQLKNEFTKQYEEDYKKVISDTHDSFTQD